MEGLDQLIRLESVGVEMPLAEVFAGVTIPPVAGVDGTGTVHRV